MAADDSYPQPRAADVALVANSPNGVLSVLAVARGLIIERDFVEATLS